MEWRKVVQDCVAAYSSRPCGTGLPFRSNPGLASWAKFSRPSGTEFGNGVLTRAKGRALHTSPAGQWLIRRQHTYCTECTLATVNRYHVVELTPLCNCSKNGLTLPERSVPICRPVGRDLRRSRRGWFEPDPIIDSVVEALFASEVPLGCLHRDMSQQELYLL